VPGLRQHGGAEDERAVAAHRRRLGELALEAGIPPGVLNVVHGYGDEAGEPLCRHPDVRAMSFTGSTATGDRIVKSAGMKKFSMELGGKSPFVIFDDADMERALDAAIFMIFSNNGERCTAGSRILVQEVIYDGFVARTSSSAPRASPSATRCPSRRSIGPMISQGAPGKGAQLHRAGRRKAPSMLCAAASSSPALPGALAGTATSSRPDRLRGRRQPHAHRPGRDLRAGRLPDPFKDEADALPRPTTPVRPQQLCLDREPRPRASHGAAIEAGMCFVNSQNVRDLRQPFGGTKASGPGREGGTWSYEVFCEPKNVAVSLANTTSRAGAH
jgi:5-carboxymethyl-2-hydroxymuconic-semialdehyde dehydrogenase